MTPADLSLHQYTLRMNRVLEHIDHHLDQPLELADLAQIAHFTPGTFIACSTPGSGNPWAITCAAGAWPTPPINWPANLRQASLRSR